MALTIMKIDWYIYTYNTFIYFCNSIAGKINQYPVFQPQKDSSTKKLKLSSLPQTCDFYRTQKKIKEHILKNCLKVT